MVSAGAIPSREAFIHDCKTNLMEVLEKFMDPDFRFILKVRMLVTALYQCIQLLSMLTLIGTDQKTRTKAFLGSFGTPDYSLL